MIVCPNAAPAAEPAKVANTAALKSSLKAAISGPPPTQPERNKRGHQCRIQDKAQVAEIRVKMNGERGNLHQSMSLLL